MIDPRVSASHRSMALATRIDWRNAYLGPGAKGGLAAWPAEAAEALSATLLDELHMGLVETPNEALREVPAHTASLLSELWMGEFVRVLREADGWWLVCGEDGYVGWLRAWASRICDLEELRELVRRRDAVFADPTGWLQGGGTARSPLMGGSPLLDLESTGNGAELGLADGSRGWLENSQLDREPPSADPKVIVDHALGLLGAAYRWGGRTPGGIDCSALVQWAAMRAGFQLHRDAVQQSVQGEEIPLDSGSWERGDLLFFHDPVDHVGLYDGEGALVHARARVRRQGLDEIPELLAGLVRVRRMNSELRIRGETLWRRIPDGGELRA